MSWCRLLAGLGWVPGLREHSHIAPISHTPSSLVHGRTRRNLLESRLPSPLPSPTESETLRVGSHDLCFNKFIRRFWCKIKYEKYWLIPIVIFLALSALLLKFSHTSESPGGLFKTACGLPPTKFPSWQDWERPESLHCSRFPGDAWCFGLGTTF